MALPKYLRTSSSTGVPTEQAATITAVADSIVATDSTGTIPAVLLPTGVVAPTEPIVASEALAAGDLVNVYDNAGSANCRKADASAAAGAKRAHGFVLASVISSGTATVYFGDPNTAVTGLTSGTQFLSASTPGKSVSVGSIPTGSGQLVQQVGVAVGATVLVFAPNTGYILA